MDKEMKPSKGKQKYNRRQRLYQNRKHKPYASKRNPSGKGVIPLVERCIDCGKNTTNHHLRCNKHWRLNVNQKRKT